MLPPKHTAQDLKSAQIGAALPQYPLVRRQTRVQASQPRCSHGQFVGASLGSSAAQFGSKCMIARRALLVAITQAPLAVAMAVQGGRTAAAEPVEAPRGDECVAPHPVSPAFPAYPLPMVHQRCRQEAALCGQHERHVCACLCPDVDALVSSSPPDSCARAFVLIVSAGCKSC